MKEKRRLMPPDLPKTLTDATELTCAMLASLDADEDLEALRLTGAVIGPLPFRRVTFRGCEFVRCTFALTEETQTDFLDCALDRCDLAGAQLHRASMQRVTLHTCRGVGLYLTDAYLRSVTMADCQFSYANFGGAKLHTVRMERCDLSHASFGESKLEQLVWDACKLQQAELFGTRLDGMDLRTNEIGGIVLGDGQELKGSMVTPLQAVGLARLLGVTVAD